MKTKLLEFMFNNKWLIGFNLLGLYLFVKMAEDVIAGLGLGLFWVTFLTLLRKWYRVDGSEGSI